MRTLIGSCILLGLTLASTTAFANENLRQAAQKQLWDDFKWIYRHEADADVNWAPEGEKSALDYITQYERWELLDFIDNTQFFHAPAAFGLISDSTFPILVGVADARPARQPKAEQSRKRPSPTPTIDEAVQLATDEAHALLAHAEELFENHHVDLNTRIHDVAATARLLFAVKERLFEVDGLIEDTGPYMAALQLINSGYDKVMRQTTLLLSFQTQLTLLTTHLREGTLTLQMFEERGHDNNLYQQFGEANAEALILAAQRETFANFAQLESAYAGLLFLRFAGQHTQQMFEKFMSMARKLELEKLMALAWDSKDPSTIEEGYKSAKIYYGLHLGKACDAMKLRIKEWEDKLRVAK